MNVVFGNLSIVDEGLTGVVAHSAEMTRPATQSVASGATLVNFTSEKFDNHGSIVDLTNEKLVVQKAGYYHVYASVSTLSAPTGGTYKRIIIRRYNSGGTLQESIIHSIKNAGSNLYNICDHIFSASLNDYFQLYYEHDDATHNISSSTSSHIHVHPWLGMVKLSDA